MKEKVVCSMSFMKEGLQVFSVNILTSHAYKWFFLLIVQITELTFIDDFHLEFARLVFTWAEPKLLPMNIYWGWGRELNCIWNNWK